MFISRFLSSNLNPAASTPNPILGAAATNPANPLFNPGNGASQDVLSAVYTLGRIDADGDHKISELEFKNWVGAGGDPAALTNLSQLLGDQLIANPAQNAAVNPVVKNETQGSVSPNQNTQTQQQDNPTQKMVKDSTVQSNGAIDAPGDKVEADPTKQQKTDSSTETVSETEDEVANPADEMLPNSNQVTDNVSTEDRKAPSELQTLWKKVAVNNVIKPRELFKQADVFGEAEGSEGDGFLNEAQYKYYASLLDLKIPYAKLAGEKGIDEKKLIDTIMSADKDGNKRVSEDEFNALNASFQASEDVEIDVSDDTETGDTEEAQDTEETEQTGQTQDTENVDSEDPANEDAEEADNETPAAKPDYFAINTDKYNGVSHAELKAFLEPFTEEGKFTEQKTAAAMIYSLDWGNSRTVEAFRDELVQVATVDEAVDLIFDKLNRDKQVPDNISGLIRSEWGDLVQPRQS